MTEPSKIAEAFAQLTLVRDKGMLPPGTSLTFASIIRR
jgi:hypothetical protein